MAVRSVATTNTLEQFRTTFNSLASTDIGDVATLTTSASSIVGAINELDSGTVTICSTSIALGATATTITGLTSLNSAALTVDNVNVATQPFAIAQAIALG